jgi:membrane-associated progesterone receptor component
MSFSFSHPINTALLLYILYLLQRIIFPSTSLPRKPPAEFKAGYSWMPRSHPPALLFTIYTPRTLAKFDGRDGGRILLSISGTVFDVTAGRGFYGPGKALPFLPLRSLHPKGGGGWGWLCAPLIWLLTVFQDGMYGNFAGRDASRGMAKQSFDLGASLLAPGTSSSSRADSILEMLTPVDQPLDKLDGLTPEEMSVPPAFSTVDGC